MDVKGRKAQQAEETRTALIGAARELFGQRGAATTSLEEIAQRAGVTKGALYHHFRDKADLFRATLERIQRELSERVARAEAAGKGPWDRLTRAAHAYLDACLEPDVLRIVIVDAPAVLSWDTWCRIDKEYGVRMFEGPLRDAQAEGLMGAEPAAQLAEVVLGALNVAGRVIARAEDRAAASDQVRGTIDRLLQGLRAPVAALVGARVPRATTRTASPTRRPRPRATDARRARRPDRGKSPAR